MSVATPPADSDAVRGSGRAARCPKRIGWQGLTFQAPESWDLTGFSGDFREGYLRADDSEQQGIEIKWATESPRAKTPPDVAARRRVYLNSLRAAARKKKVAFEEREQDPPRGMLRPERTRVEGFAWTGDRKAIGAVWHCATCRRVVIAQVLGAPSGRGGLVGLAEAVLGTVACHDAEPGWRVWALYDLIAQVPSSFTLVVPQLMNVYLRLSLARGTDRLTIEQWALANVARRGAYLDEWVRRNARGELAEMRCDAREARVGDHPAVAFSGGPALGMPMARAAREAMRLQRPATRFQALAWECEASNKIYLVESLRPASAPDALEEVAQRIRCHEEE